MAFLDPKRNPTTIKVSIAGSAGPDTEYAIPDGTREITLQSRTAVDWVYAWDAGAIAAGTYATVAGNGPRTWKDFEMPPGAKLYLRSSAAGAQDLDGEIWR